MRRDMAKKLVETHRYGGDRAYRHIRANDKNRDIEDLPKRENMRTRYGWDRKEFGENFPPLLGYLRKNCGRPWGKVYSELCSALKGGSTVIEHVKLHLFRDFLEVKPIWQDGKPHRAERGSNNELYPLTEGNFYVDRQGLLQMSTEPRWARSKKNKLPDFLDVSFDKGYLKIKGIWHELEFQPTANICPSNKYLEDTVLGTTEVSQDKVWSIRGLIRVSNIWKPTGGKVKMCWEHRRQFTRNGRRYCVSCKQMNSRDIKRMLKKHT